MIDVSSLMIDDKSVLGLRVDLADSPAPLLIVIAEKGFVMCGFLNIEAAERLNTAAAMVSGVKTYDDLLKGQVRAVTTNARSLGVEIGMSGADALRNLL